jgi:hypothetical protein
MSGPQPVYILESENQQTDTREDRSVGGYYSYIFQNKDKGHFKLL